jgi:MFS family permease
MTVFRQPVRRIYVAKGLRAFGDGYVSLLLPAYLLQLGFGPAHVGVIATTTLLGSGLMTLGVGLHARRVRDRTMLLVASAIMAGTGIGFASCTEFWPLLLIALVGTLNPSSGDVSVFLPLEHAVLSRAVEDRGRTVAFARYSMVGALAAALGALAAGVPAALVSRAGVEPGVAMQAMFVLYAGLAMATAAVYRGLPSGPSATERTRPAPLTASRRKVFTLAALFSLDAFGGGFIVQSIVALWLYQRFALPLEAAGVLFFWTGLASALSYPVAARLANRFGLVNTMVFTHLPSSLCLVAMPFLPSLGGVIALLIVRAALSQMDVPTRSSYVMAIVPPDERAAAASVTSVPRSLASALSPALAGSLLSVSTFAWPLLVAGGVKIAYDLLLLALFRTVRPPEEQPKPAHEPLVHARRHVPDVQHGHRR